MTVKPQPSPHLGYIEDLLSGREVLRISIPDADGNVVGFLTPLTQTLAEDDTLIEQFVRWRNQNLSGWLDQRPVTFEGTRAWARNVTRDPTRLALLMYAGDKLIGRCGYLELTADECLSDGLVRGERGGGLYFVHHAQVAGLIWQFETLGIRSVLSKVLSTNDAALESCRRLGYDLTCVESRPLFRHEDVQGVYFLEHGEADQVFEESTILYLRLSKEDFLTSESLSKMPGAKHQPSSS